MTSPVGLARPMLASPPPFVERPAQAPAETSSGARQDAAPPIAPNPSLRIEPTLGVVVFEVRDGAGEVTRSVPTERELRAYRTAALRGEDVRGEDAPDAASRATGAADQIRNPPGGSPSSASALDVPADGAPKPPVDSEARLIK